MKSLLLLFAVAAGAVQAGDFVGQIWREPGDIMLGFVLAVHDNNASMTAAYDPRYACGDLVTPAALLVPTFRRAIKAINDDPKKLGGLKLGYDIVDSCKLPTHAVDIATPWAITKVMRLQDPTIMPPPPLVVIGAYNSRVSAPLAVMLQQFDIPLIDYASTAADLSDRRRYPLFARTSPSDIYQAVALSVMAAKLGHQCVHLVYSQGLYGELGAAEIRKNLKKLGICLASDQIAPALETAEAMPTFTKIVANLSRTSTAKGVICFCEDTTSRSLLKAIKTGGAKTNFQILASDFWGTGLDLTGLESAADGTISVTVGASSSASHDPKTFSDLGKDALNQDPFFREVLENKFRCTFNQAKVTASLPKCNPSSFAALTAVDLPVQPFLGMMQQTIKAVTNGISTLVTGMCAGYTNKTDCLPKINAGQMAPELYGLIVSATDGTTALFDKNGDGPATYEFNWYSASNKPNPYVVVANWKSSSALTTTAEFSRIPKITSTCGTC